MTYFSSLRDAIRKLHGCDSQHERSVHVTETFQGNVLWDGKVEVFKLNGHPTAQQAYAWAYLDQNQRSQYVAVLHTGPVDSPQRAVKAAIAARIKAKQR